MKKRALLIGINDYFDFRIRNLNGCINDTKIVRSALETRFGFNSDEITRLTDKEATHDAIAGEMKQILEMCEPNDTIVFYFSGHGTRRISDNPDKADGLEEAIVTYDSRGDPGGDKDIRQSDFRDWIALLAKKTSNIHLLFDCCHSGSITRDGSIIGIGDAKGVETDASREILFPQVKRPQRRPGYAGIFSSYSDSSPSSNWLSLTDNYSLLTACRKDEVAMEGEMTVDGERMHYGAFTNFLIRELIRPENLTYSDVFEQLHIAIGASPFSQTPQIVGVKTRRPFSTEEIDTMKYITVRDRADNNNITLSGGVVHGITADSEWSIYEPGTKLPRPEDKVGYAKIARVGVASSGATIVEEDRDRKILPGCRAVEEIHYFENEKRSVYISASADDGAKQVKEIIARDIQASSWIKHTDEEKEADFIVSVSPPWFINSTGDRFQADVLRANDRSVLVKMSGLGRDDLWKISENLVKLGRHSAISVLENPSSKLSGLVEFTLFQKTRGEWRKAEPAYNSIPHFVEGDPIGFQITNNSSLPLYVGVLDMGLTKNIKLLFPNNADSDRFGAKTSKNQGSGILKVGMDNGGMIDLYIPDEAFLTEFPDIDRRGGLEIFKLIVTTDQTNLSFNEQPGLRTRTRSRSSLEELLNRYSGNIVTRETKTQDREMTDWLTINRPFYLFKIA